MSKPQYAILRFAKYKGPEISHIEAHNERTKEKYASNPDVDTSRSSQNFHLVIPQRKYRTESEKQIVSLSCAPCSSKRNECIVFFPVRTISPSVNR